MGTTTRVVDVKETVAPVKSSPPKKWGKIKQHDSPVNESETYFTIKTNEGKSRESSLVTSVHISLIQYKTSILN